MTAQWYALQSKPMKEFLLFEQLNLRCIESYFPYIRVRPVNPRARKLRAYFPGYVFGRLDLEQTSISTLQWIPGTLGIVSFDGVPSYVPDNLIGAIRRRVDEINAAGGELLRRLKTGDPLTIQDGPFRGFEAIFDAHTSGEERVRVLLKLLNRKQIPLELSVEQIRIKK